MISSVDKASTLIVTFSKYTVQTNLGLRRKRRQYYLTYLAHMIKFILTKITYYMRKLKFGNNRGLSIVTEAKFQLVSNWL